MNHIIIDLSMIPSLGTQVIEPVAVSVILSISSIRAFMRPFYYMKG